VFLTQEGDGEVFFETFGIRAMLAGKVRSVLVISIGRLVVVKKLLRMGQLWWSSVCGKGCMVNRMCRLIVYRS